VIGEHGHMVGIIGEAVPLDLKEFFESNKPLLLKLQFLPIRPVLLLGVVEVGNV